MRTSPSKNRLLPGASCRSQRQPQRLCTRRQFVARITCGVGLGLLPSGRVSVAAEPEPRSQIKAIAFDAFPVFDPRPIFALAERLFPGRGAELSNEWRTRQFEYTWLRVAAERYADFWQVTNEALEFAAAKLDLDLKNEKRDQLMRAYLELQTWPDVVPALTSLRKSGFKLAFLSNFTPHMLEANVANGGLGSMFDHVLSTDLAKTYKPAPRAYQIGTDVLKLSPREILFVAFAGWDAAGAKLFGYPVFWLNRQKLPPERLGAVPDCTGNSLTQLIRFLA